jgi:hypothetical protein
VAKHMNHIMDAPGQITNDKPLVLHLLLHFHKEPHCAQKIREVISNNYFISISISNCFIQFLYYFQKFYKCNMM